MSEKPKVLVFPCGTEIGLTIWDSLRHMNEIELWGASSADDHGRFVYKNYIGGVPMVDSPDFVPYLSLVCEINEIDYIYPAHDDVIVALAGFSMAWKPITPDYGVCRVCRSKAKTYRLFPEISPIQWTYERGENLAIRWFCKPDKGQGSKGCYIIEADEIGRVDMVKYTIVEYLPGPEFTVDCFTDRHGVLRFCEGRNRTRIKNGIAVRTKRVVNPEFRRLADIIGSRLKMRGQWFFQVKEDSKGELKLLEIAPRPAGSSILWTAHGVYLPKLTVLDRMGLDVEIDFVEDSVEMDRALGHRFWYERKAV